MYRRQPLLKPYKLVKDPLSSADGEALSSKLLALP
jgi:hypothetical protein